MAKRKRPQKRTGNGRTPLKKRRRSKVSTTKVNKQRSKREPRPKRRLLKIYKDFESSTSRSSDTINQKKRQPQQNNKKKLRFALEEDDELEAAKKRLFNLRQMKVVMQDALYKFQQQVKCISEEIEELHEKLERLLARHTREQVQECSCKEKKE